MTGAEVRALKDEEIVIELGKLRSKVFSLRAQSVTEKVENNQQARGLRRDVARLLTEKRRRELAAKA